MPKKHKATIVNPKTQSTHITMMKFNYFRRAAIILLPLTVVLSSTVADNTSLSIKEKMINNEILLEQQYNTKTFPSDGRIGRVIHHAGQDWCQSSSKIVDFVQDVAPNVINPSSKFNNVKFPFQIQLEDGTFDELTVPIESLTSNLYLLEMALTKNDSYRIQDQILGHNGEHTQELVDQHEILLNFWNIPVEQFPILFTGAHSESLEEYMEVAIEAWLLIEGYSSDYDITDDVIAQVSYLARNAIETELPSTYANSILSLDAFYLAFYFDIPELENKSIMIFGDGMLDFVNYLGESEVGNAVIHAHEFSHYLQFMLDLEDYDYDTDKYYEHQQDSDPYTTRRDELEADAMAAYALAHDQGRNFDVSLLVTTSEVIYHFGDCDTTDIGHHGSPKQRECAIRWGADTGLDLTGSPISPREFRDRFNKNLDGILSLDPSACSLTEGESGDEPGQVGNVGGDGVNPTTYGEDELSDKYFKRTSSPSSLSAAATMTNNALFSYHGSIIVAGSFISGLLWS